MAVTSQIKTELWWY